MPPDAKPVPVPNKPEEPILFNLQASALAKPNAYEIAAWIITGLALFLVLRLHLLSALLSGLLVYELVHLAVPILRIGRLSRTRAKLLGGLTVGRHHYFSAGSGYLGPGAFFLSGIQQYLGLAG